MTMADVVRINAYVSAAEYLGGYMKVRDEFVGSPAAGLDAAGRPGLFAAGVQGRDRGDRREEQMTSSSPRKRGSRGRSTSCPAGPNGASCGPCIPAFARMR